MDPVVDSGRLELIAGELRGIVRIGEMQVNAPSRSERSVLIKDILVDVLLRKYVIAKEPPGLPLSGDIRHPIQAPVCETAVAGMVLQPTPV